MDEHNRRSAGEQRCSNPRVNPDILEARSIHTSHQVESQRQHPGPSPSQTGSAAPFATRADAGIEEASPPSSTYPPRRASSFIERNKEKLSRLKGFLTGSKYGRNEPELRREHGGHCPEQTAISGDQDAQEQEPDRSTGTRHYEHGSSSGRSKGRQQGKIYDFVELVPDKEGYYRCKLCKKELGKKNATRFSKHSIEDCPRVETPVKVGLARRTKSKTIGPPRCRSDAAVALERANNPNRELQAVSEAQDNEISSARVSTGSHGRGGRRNSANSAESRLSKRRKTAKYAQPPECDPGYVKKVISSTVEFLVKSSLPFNVFDKRNGEDSDFLCYLRTIHPALVSKHIPGGQLLSGKYLDEFYDKMRRDVKKSIAEALDGGYASVIFDGWDDVNSSPVVNVLLKMEPAVHSGNKVFFLKTVYTGSKTVGATEYVKIIEDVMSEYGGLGRICAITSDNTSCCLNARAEITKKYMGIVGVNDQSHVADLLIEDVCKISWISGFISKVCAISKELHNHRKLKERFKVMMAEFNECLKKESVYLDESLPNNSGWERSDRHTGNFNVDRDPALVFADVGKLSIRTAVMLLQSSNTRFASAEGVLDSFLRSIYVLRTLVTEPDFYTALFKPRNAAHKRCIKEEFVDTIGSADFENATREIHTILVLLRRYLRLFDSNDARISEVYPFTVELARMLENLPVTPFLTGERKSELLNVFRTRKDGPISRHTRVRLLDDVHYTAFLLDPNQAPLKPQDLMVHFRNHARRYAASQNISNVDGWVENLTFAYACQVSAWGAERDGMEGRKNIRIYNGNPLIWWSFAYVKHKELGEFARRTLSCSPTSCAVERSFSAQKRIHPKERSRLSHEKVQKLVFCQWNLRLMRKLDTFNKHSFWKSVEQATNMITGDSPAGGSGNDTDSDADVNAHTEEESHDRNSGSHQVDSRSLDNQIIHGDDEQDGQ